MSEISLTGDMTMRDTGIEAIMFSLFLIPDDGEKSLEIGELLHVLEQLKEKEADRIVSMASAGGVS